MVTVNPYSTRFSNGRYIRIHRFINNLRFHQCHLCNEGVENVFNNRTINVLCQLILCGATSQRLECPRECTCEHSPLRSASFVLTWMTSWGEDDLPNIHPNE
ncbi:hypothetical protein Avbf_05097, partial [Armadillidium vulgare]